MVSAARKLQQRCCLVVGFVRFLWLQRGRKRTCSIRAGGCITRRKFTLHKIKQPAGRRDEEGMILLMQSAGRLLSNQ